MDRPRHLTWRLESVTHGAGTRAASPIASGLRQTMMHRRRRCRSMDPPRSCRLEAGDCGVPRGGLYLRRLLIARLCGDRHDDPELRSRQRIAGICVRLRAVVPLTFSSTKLDCTLATTGSASSFSITKRE